MKNKLLYILCLFVLGCDDDIEPGNCSSGLIEDDCEQCGGDSFYNIEDDSESGWDCGINNEDCEGVDLCGFCAGEIWEINDCDNKDIECCGCTSSNAVNYNPNATINNNSCDYYPYSQIVDLQYLTIEPSCINIPTNPFIDQSINCDDYSSIEYYCEDQEYCRWSRIQEIPKNLSIYWINTSNTTISLQTTDTDEFCCNTLDNNDCSLNLNESECNTSTNCEWSTCSTYNEDWNDFDKTIPANTTSVDDENIYISNFFIPYGFSQIQIVEYCAEINNIEECGIIKIIE